MDINNFIDYLNKTKGWELNSDYYGMVEEWRLWWKGYVPSFHEYTEVGLDKTQHKRQLFRMGMAKKVCEDWASLLLNDKTTVTVDDDATAKWLYGTNDLTDGVLQELEFWDNANNLVELMMRSGGGAFVMTCENVLLESGKIVPSADAKIVMDYLPAECILPVTIRHNKVIDCAFASEIIEGGEEYYYLQTHQLVNRVDERGQPYKTYRITNEYFKEVEHPIGGAETRYTKVTPSGTVTGTFETGSDIPWFAIITPNVVKNIDGGRGLGMAIYSGALDQIMHCDTAFNNYHRDIYLGGKKVFYSKKLISEVMGSDGHLHEVTPDDVQQQLFWQDSDADPNAGASVTDYNPALRTAENAQAVQDALDYLSFKVGLGTHFYQFTNASYTTAKEYVGSRQDMVQHANKHQIKIEKALKSIMKAIIWAGKNICGAPVNPDSTVVINWDDSYITDTETRRLQAKDDALNGFIPKYRYNMLYNSMSEDEAKKAVEEAMSEQPQPVHPQNNLITVSRLKEEKAPE